MSSVAHHLVSRAVDATQQHFSTPVDGNDDTQIKRVAVWGVVLVWVTAIIYMAFMAAISYTYGDVVATLAMIETPTATAFKVDPAESEEIDAPLLSEGQKSEKMTAVESDLFLVKQKPITSKLRTAVKHLKAQGGRLARFRGLHVSLMYHLVHSIIVHLFTANASPLARSIVHIVTTVALCRFYMTWTHIVISAPSTKRWYQRIPSVKAGKNIIIPAAVFAIAQQVAIYVPRALFLAVGETLQNPSDYGSNPETVQKVALVQMLLVGLIAISSIILIVIPADVTLKRVQASMLPEDDESIVPFDRTFAGQVKPEILGGSGAVSMLDAWKTFDRSARIRLMKIYAKVFALQVAITIMFLMIAVGELRLIMGDDLAKLGRIAHAHIKGQQ
ncbi:hypothetical protein MMC28_010789 [Mycoblastus sanguinarius]|nr:hypothetical protein [Mycoblastus sanguinarius]